MKTAGQLLRAATLFAALAALLFGLFSVPAYADNLGKPMMSFTFYPAEQYRALGIQADGETWSGRGHAPLWLRQLELQGRKREEFIVTEG